MDPLVYHNGRFLPESEATLSVQDRGVLFADGVYEVVRYDRGRPFAMRAHVDRLRRSLAGIELAGVDPSEIAGVSDELMRRGGLTDARVYWQVTRGPARRDFVVPADPEPSVTLIAYPMPPLDPDAPLAAGPAMIAEDCRWTRCWIKSLMLLPASLAKSRAKAGGAVEAIFERHKPGGEKHITEGSSTNVFIVQDGRLRTHPTDGWVLPGVTREVVVDLAAADGVACDADTPFDRQTLQSADEVFVCSTTQFTAITSVDGHAIADGRPGPITQRLAAAYSRAILSGD